MDVNGNFFGWQGLNWILCALGKKAMTNKFNFRGAKTLTFRWKCDSILWITFQFRVSDFATSYASHLARGLWPSEMHLAFHTPSSAINSECPGGQWANIYLMTSRKLQGSINRRAPGSVNFVLALAYHFWLNLPAAFTQPGACPLVEPCTALHIPWYSLP